MAKLEAIQSAIRRCEVVTPEILRQIDAALDSDPSAKLWILRGDAIQLSDGDSYNLADAEQSYQRAIELEPLLPEPYESLGYFYFAVTGDAATAKTYFERAIALGGGESASSGLQEALSELRDHAFQPSEDQSEIRRPFQTPREVKEGLSFGTVSFIPRPSSSKNVVAINRVALTGLEVRDSPEATLRGLRVCGDRVEESRIRWASRVRLISLTYVRTQWHVYPFGFRCR